VVVIAWWLDLQLPVQSMLFTTKVVSSNPVHSELYSMTARCAKRVLICHRISSTLLTWMSGIQKYKRSKFSRNCWQYARLYALSGFHRVVTLTKTTIFNVLASNFNLDHWYSTVDKYGCISWNIQTFLKNSRLHYLAHLAKGNVSFCHLSSVNFSHLF
jgi:hypothetical protein